MAIPTLFRESLCFNIAHIVSVFINTLHWPGFALARSGSSNWLQVLVNPAWMSTMGVTGYGSNLVAQ